MTKFKDLSDGRIIEITDKNRIAKLKGYPDKFQLVEETEAEKKEVKGIKKPEETKKNK